MKIYNLKYASLRGRQAEAISVWDCFVIASLFLAMTLFSTSKSFADEPFAVVELFTSQGCSSCPPADRLLREINKIAKDQKKRIFPLSFHVDYWNYLGWKDPYSKTEYTVRQQQYASLFNNKSTYTPQMVINGTHEFVGSDRGKMMQYIDQELSQNEDAELTLKPTIMSPQKIKITYLTNLTSRSVVLNLALVERHMGNDVVRGENAGKNLQHDNVVKLFSSTILTNNDGETILSVPTDINLANSSLIGYLQEKTTGRVIAAQATELPL